MDSLYEVAKDGTGFSAFFLILSSFHWEYNRANLELPGLHHFVEPAKPSLDREVEKWQRVTAQGLCFRPSNVCRKFSVRKCKMYTQLEVQNIRNGCRGSKLPWILRRSQLCWCFLARDAEAMLFESEKNEDESCGFIGWMNLCFMDLGRVFKPIITSKM